MRTIMAVVRTLYVSVLISSTVKSELTEKLKTALGHLRTMATDNKSLLELPNQLNIEDNSLCIRSNDARFNEELYYANAGTVKKLSITIGKLKAMLYYARNSGKKGLRDPFHKHLHLHQLKHRGLSALKMLEEHGFGEARDVLFTITDSKVKGGSCSSSTVANVKKVLINIHNQFIRIADGLTT